MSEHFDAGEWERVEGESSCTARSASSTRPQTPQGNVDGAEQKPKYGFADYDTNTVLGGDEALLQDIVQDSSGPVV